MSSDYRLSRSWAAAVFKITDSVTALLIVGMTVAIMFRVVNRWFQLGISGQGELAQILLMSVVYLNIAKAAKVDNDIKSDYLFDRIPKRLQPAANVATLLNNIVMTVVIVVSTLLVIEVSLPRTTTSLSAPVPLLYIPLLFGAGLLALVYSAELASSVRTLNERWQREDSP